MVGFTSYEVDNDKSFQRALDSAINKVGNLRFAMGEISRDIYKNTRKNFILSGSGRYPPLTPKYAAFKQKKAGSVPILVGVKDSGGISGRLRDSVTLPTNSDSILKIGEQSLVQGTKVPYARFVQDGTRIMPGRKFLFLDEAQVRRLERILEDTVAGKLEQSGVGKID